MQVVLPVLAVDLVSSQGVVKHQDLVGVLQSWSGVLAVLQLNSSIQQREVPPDNQGVRTVCGADTDSLTEKCFTGCREVVLVHWWRALVLTGDVADEGRGEDAVQH